MKLLIRRTGLVLCMVPLFVQAQDISVKQVQLKQFYLQSSEVVKNDGSALSLPGYRSKNWFPVAFNLPC